MDTLSQGPHFERGFEPELDLKLLQLPVRLLASTLSLDGISGMLASRD